MSKDEMSFYKKKKIDSRYTKDETPQDELGRHQKFTRLIKMYATAKDSRDSDILPSS